MAIIEELPPDSPKRPQASSSKAAVPPKTAAASPFSQLSLSDPVGSALAVFTRPEFYNFVAGALILGEVVLCSAIILKVPYTEIDWTTYHQQVSLFLSGERDYSKIQGDTGPLVYPAGFLWVYSALNTLTEGGKDIKLAQWWFAGLYVATQAMVFKIFKRCGSVPPYALILLTLSKRMHSIFLLRLFNDPVGMFFFYAAVLAWTARKPRWSVGSVLFSLALSIKMNHLITLPSLLYLFYLHLGLIPTVFQLALIALPQLILAFPFLDTSSHALTYFHTAFDFKREFLWEWTVNWRWVGEEAFESVTFSKVLLVAHVVVLVVVGVGWAEKDGGLVRLVWDGVKKPMTPPSQISPTPDRIATILFTSTLVGILFARSLHYQFYSWYFHAIPHLLEHTPYDFVMRLWAKSEQGGVLPADWATEGLRLDAENFFMSTPSPKTLLAIRIRDHISAILERSSTQIASDVLGDQISLKDQESLLRGATNLVEAFQADEAMSEPASPEPSSRCDSSDSRLGQSTSMASSGNLPPELKLIVVEKEFAALCFPFIWKPAGLLPFLLSLVSRRGHLVKRLVVRRRRRLCGTALESLQEAVLALLILHLPNLVAIEIDFSADKTTGKFEIPFVADVLRLIGAKLEELSLLPETYAWSPYEEKDVANLVKSFLNLRRLHLMNIVEDTQSDGNQLIDVVTSMERLRELVVINSGFVNDNFARSEFKSSLEVLRLSSCNKLSLSGFVDLLFRHAQTLHTFEFDITPGSDLAPGNDNYLAQPFPLALPKLRKLGFATSYYDAPCLDLFDLCDIEEFTIGYCPDIEREDWAAFIVTHENVPTLSRTMSKVASTSKATKAKKGSLKPSSDVPPLGKFLASSEKSVRDKAVASLSRFLAGTKKSAGEEEEELEVGELDWDAAYEPDERLRGLEMAKLWKGIFFCFWMSDKPLVQQALANSLALLTLDVRPKKSAGRPQGRVARVRSALCYLRGFWDAVVREWSGLDRLRLDKFYMLIRRFVHVAFLLLAREGWDAKAVEEYNEILTGPGGPLHVLDSRIPHSIAYHLADIYVDEIESSISTPLVTLPSPPSTIPLLSLLAPFYTTLSLAPSSTLFTRVSSNVFVPLLEASLTKPEPEGKKRKFASEIVKPTFDGVFEKSEEEREEVGKKVLERLFEVGGGKETNEVNRRRLYVLYKEWAGED
ncbi:hypothetical protein MNV49_002320 [Pseudohyphozyma bogoriensis]|nr:hypothetical protein MNV49_002320 [Pseudohyphozyma bogoriensis]